MTLEHTSAITASSSRTSASVDGKGKRLARHSWSRRSIKWSADDSSKNSRCNGRYAGPIFCCRPGRGSSTRIWTTYSAVGIQNSGHNHKRRSQSARRLDPRLFGALVWDERNQCEVKLLTNQLQFAASTIAAIYRERWQIELFFKALKQNLKIKTFVGTSANAVRIQIWTALLAILLLKILQFKSTFGWALSNLVALLRWNLFSYRDLWEWINRPFDTPPESPGIQGELFDLDSILRDKT